MSVVQKYLDTPTPKQVDPMVELIDLCNTISTEAFAVGNLSGYLNRRIAQLSNAAREAFRSVFTRNFKTPEVLNAAPVARLLQTIQYTELADKLAYIPTGFTGNFREYTQELETKVQPYLVGLTKEVLIPSQKRFGHYLNNLQDINERRNFEAGSKYSLQMLEERIRDEGKWTIRGNHRDNAPWGELFNNNGEISAAFMSLNQVNQACWKASSPQLVEREVNRLMQIATTLFEYLEEEASEHATAQFVEMLATELQTVARWVEWYSVMATRLLDITAAMKENEKQLMAL